MLQHHIAIRITSEYRRLQDRYFTETGTIIIILIHIVPHPLHSHYSTLWGYILPVFLKPYMEYGVSPGIPSISRKFHMISLLPCLLSLDLSIVHGLCGGKPYFGGPRRSPIQLDHMNSNYEMIYIYIYYI